MGCQSILFTINQFCGIFTRAFEKGCRGSPFLHVWYEVLDLPVLWKNAPLWDVLNAAQNFVLHTCTASLLRCISQSISKAAVGFCLQGNSVYSPKSTLEASSAQHCGPASVTGPDESNAQVFPFPGANTYTKS